ncbi:hypothetical protein MPTK2_2g17080 [Marchantia polymorpha subsp. ruderalis]
MSDTQKESQEQKSSAAEVSQATGNLFSQFSCLQFSTPKATVVDIERRLQRPTDPLTQLPVFFDSDSSNGTKALHALGKKKHLKPSLMTWRKSNAKRKLFNVSGKYTEEPKLHLRRSFDDYLDPQIIDEEARKLLRNTQDPRLKIPSDKESTTSAVQRGSFDWPSEELHAMYSCVQENTSNPKFFEAEAQIPSQPKERLGEQLKLSFVKNEACVYDTGTVHLPSQGPQAIKHSLQSIDRNFPGQVWNLSPLRKRLQARLKISSIGNVPASSDESCDLPTKNLQARSDEFSQDETVGTTSNPNDYLIRLEDTMERRSELSSDQVI